MPKPFDFQRFANINQVLDFQRFYASLRCGVGGSRGRVWGRVGCCFIVCFMEAVNFA